MNSWMALAITATLVVGVVGIGLAATGRPLVGISMTVFSVTAAHLNWVRRHE